jgi:hypothetical protein
LFSDVQLFTIAGSQSNALIAALVMTMDMGEENMMAGPMGGGTETLMVPKTAILARYMMIPVILICRAHIAPMIWVVILVVGYLLKDTTTGIMIHIVLRINPFPDMKADIQAPMAVTVAATERWTMADRIPVM